MDNKFILVQWWDEAAGKFQQEYFRSPANAFDRFINLKDLVADSDPDIETLTFSD